MPDTNTPPAAGDTPPADPTVTPPADEQPPTDQPPAPAPKALTPEEVLDALGKQLDAIEIPNMNSESAKKWLKDFRIPLASMTTNALIGLVQARVAGTTDAALEATLRKLSPAELNQVLSANVAALDKIKEQRVREAALLKATHEKLTSVAADFVMNALLRVLGVPAVLSVTKPKTA